mgnify:CR=1 FL=1
MIEAKIRIRQQELHVEKERLRRFQEGLEDDGVPPVIDRFRHNFTNLHGFTLPPNNADEFESGEHDSQAVDASSSADQTVLSSQSEEFAHQIPTIARPSLRTPTMRSLASSFHRSNRLALFLWFVFETFIYITVFINRQFCASVGMMNLIWVSRILWSWRQSGYLSR